MYSCLARVLGDGWYGELSCLVREDGCIGDDVGKCSDAGTLEVNRSSV